MRLFQILRRHWAYEKAKEDTGSVAISQHEGEYISVCIAPSRSLLST
jgi:hypothetical protein